MMVSVCKIRQKGDREQSPAPSRVLQDTLKKLTKYCIDYPGLAKNL